jgi:predicted phosphodiesterase
METFNYRITQRSRNDVFKIWAIGDVHFGARTVDKVALKKTVKYIAQDKYSYVLLMGDLIDGVTHRDKRFNPAHIDQSYRVEQIVDIGKTQTEQAYECLYPIKDKVIASIQGNHEWKLWKDTGYDSSMELSYMLDCAYLGYSGYVHLTFTRRGRNTNNGTSKSFLVYMHHGSGSAATQGGAANKLTKLIQKFDADIYLQGHIHRPQIQPMTTLQYNAKTNTVEERKRILAFSGSYLKTYPVPSDPNHTVHSTYGERAQYDPVTVGPVTIMIKPSHGMFDGRYNVMDFDT